LRRLHLFFVVSLHRNYLAGCLEEVTNAERREKVKLFDLGKHRQG